MAAMADAVLLFGGSFDPIHVGHLIVARHVREALGVDRVVLVPAAVPPHKQRRPLAAPAHRLEMTRLAVAGEGDFAVDGRELAREGPSYTIDTVAEYRRELREGVEICWLIGSDTVRELGTWHRIGELAEMCRFVTAARPGFGSGDLDALAAALPAAQIERLGKSVVPAPLVEVSSTQVRRRVADGRSIRYLVPDPVAAYIRTHGLYR
jgi:nicotinate-nucleotide adenylyltransferase